MKSRFSVMLVVLVIFALVMPSIALAGDGKDQSAYKKARVRHQESARDIKRTVGHILRNTTIGFTYVRTGSANGYFMSGHYVPPTGYGWQPTFYGGNGLPMGGYSIPQGVPQYVPTMWYNNGGHIMPMSLAKQRQVMGDAQRAAERGIPYVFQGQTIVPQGYMIQPGYGQPGAQIQIIVVKASEADEDEDQAEDVATDEDQESDDDKPHVRRGR
jgi:hypothetical protein